MKQKLSVLILMEDFAPVNNCGSIPNTKLVKYLARQDLDITLMISELLPGLALDENLVPSELDAIKVLRIPYGRFFKKTLGSARAKASKTGALQKMKAENHPIRQHVVSILKSVYFRFRCLDYLHHGKSVIRRNLLHSDFDIVYSTFPSSQPHKLAKYTINKKIARKWVADFRDPMAYETFDSEGYDKAMRTQHRIEQQADFITVVSNGALQKFVFPDIPQSKLSVLPNGFDPDDVLPLSGESTTSSGVLRFFYAGTLYGGKRGLDVLFRAISELSEEGIVDPDHISAEYAGNDWPFFLQFASNYHLEKICSNYGYIPHSRVMELLSEIDCSIVCSNNTSKDRGVVTGKVFELLVVGKPIVAIVTGDLADSELGAIIRDCNAGVVYEEAKDDTDYSELKRWLKAAYLEKLDRGHVRSQILPAKREQYSYPKIASDLVDVFKTVAGGK